MSEIEIYRYKYIFLVWCVIFLIFLCNSANCRTIVLLLDFTIVLSWNQNIFNFSPKKLTQTEFFLEQNARFLFSPSLFFLNEVTSDIIWQISIQLKSFTLFFFLFFLGEVVNFFFFKQLLVYANWKKRSRGRNTHHQVLEQKFNFKGPVIITFLVENPGRPEQFEVFLTSWEELIKVIITAFSSSPSCLSWTSK